MEQLTVAIADDNEKMLNMLEEIISVDKELRVVSESR